MYIAIIWTSVIVVVGVLYYGCMCLYYCVCVSHQDLLSTLTLTKPLENKGIHTHNRHNLDQCYYGCMC